MLQAANVSIQFFHGRSVAVFWLFYVPKKEKEITQPFACFGVSELEDLVFTEL